MKFLSRFKRKAKEDPPPVPSAAPAYSPDVKNKPTPPTPPSPQKRSPDELVLELGDFLHRIPAAVLAPGPHDLRYELRFEIAALSRQINKGQTTILLAEIYKRCPHIFKGELGSAAETEIRFPWQKLAKLVSLARPADGSVPADPTVESLAQKLKASRLKGAGAAPAPNDPPDVKMNQPVLPGRGGSKAASWFSKPTVDKPAEVAQPKSVAMPAPVPAPAPAVAPVPAPVPVAEKSPEPALKMPEPATKAPAPRETTTLKMPAASPNSAQDLLPFPAANETNPASAPASTAAAGQPGHTPPASVGTPAPAPSEPAAKPGEEVKLAELPPDLQRKFAVLKGDYERQIAELDRRCRTTTEARDRLAGDLEKMRRDYEKAQGDIDAEVAVTEMSREQVQKVTAEKDTLQAEMLSLKQQLISLQALQDDSKMAALMAERDALQQQKNYLSSQNAELMKKGGGAPAAGNGGGGLHLHRQIEDYQRRIAAMEATQRDTALQIAKEKDARAKAEKMLAAADKLQEESANYMESAKAEMRKEIETGARLKEIEFRKAQKELQDQITAVGNERSKAFTELENARNNISELEAKLTAALAAPAPAGPDPMQAQLVTQLEEDIESYRERLKVLLRERDEARAQVKPAEASADTEALRAELKQKERALAALRNELDVARQHAEEERAQLEKRAGSLLSAVEGARQSFTEKRAGLEPALAETRSKLEASQEEAKSLRVQLEDLRNQFQREHETLDTERKHAVSNLREQSVALEQQLTVLVRERDELRGRVETLSAELKSKIAAQEEFISTLEKDHTKVVRENDDLVRRLSEAEEGAKRGEVAAKGTADAALAEEKAKSARLAEHLASAEAALTALREQHAEELKKHVSATSAHHAETLAGLERRTAESVSALERERDQARTELAASRERVLSLEKDVRSAADREAALKAEAERLKVETERLTGELAAAAKVHEDLESARQEIHSARQEQSDLTAQHEDELLAAVRAKQELEHKLAVAESTRADLAQAFDGAEREANEARHELEQLRKTSTGSLESARTEAAGLQVKLATAQTEIGKLQEAQRALGAEIQAGKAALESQKAEAGKHQASAADLKSTLEQVRAEHGEAHGAMERKWQGAEKARQETTQALAKIERDAAGLRNELEQARAATEEANKHTATATAVLRREMDEARKTAAEATEVARKEKTALAEELRQLETAKAGVQRELETAKTDLQQARHAQAELTADLDKMRAAGSAARAEWEQKMQAAASESRLSAGRLDEERTARSAVASELADLRRQLSASRTERDQLAQQRDDLLRRLSRLTDEHRNFLDELSSPVVAAAAMPEKPARPSTPTPTVIEVEPEVFTQPEPEKAVNLPRIRPVPIQPPKVGNM